MTTKLVLPRRRTGFFTWCLAGICTVITVAVIIAGMAVFIGYLIIRPKVPSISVTYTHLDVFDYDRAGTLTAGVTIYIKWENDNGKAHASFFDAGFVLGLHGLEMAKLVAPPFDVSKNSSVELHYRVKSSPRLLNPEQMVLVDASLKQDLVTFDLNGTARTRWKVGPLGSVKFLLHFNCQLRFIRSTMNSAGSYCSSKSK